MRVVQVGKRHVVATFFATVLLMSLPNLRAPLPRSGEAGANTQQQQLRYREVVELKSRLASLESTMEATRKNVAAWGLPGLADSFDPMPGAAGLRSPSSAGNVAPAPRAPPLLSPIVTTAAVKCECFECDWTPCESCALCGDACVAGGGCLASRVDRRPIGADLQCECASHRLQKVIKKVIKKRHLEIRPGKIGRF